MESPEFAAGMRSQGLNGNGPTKRKRSALDSSPASLIDPDHDHDLDLDVDLDERADDASPDAKSRRLPGVKRACNECRQQKVRGDHQSFPWLSHRWAPPNPSFPSPSPYPPRFRINAPTFRSAPGPGVPPRRLTPALLLLPLFVFVVVVVVHSSRSIVRDKPC